MALSYKVMGQSAPASGNYTTALYTVPSSTSTVMSTIVVANRSSSPDTFRIRVAITNAAVDNKQYLAYDVPIAGNSFANFTIGMTLGATDVVYAGSAGGNLSFSAFGSEIS
jgi:glucose-6-phosphate dehydrogenase assembly protein OpcA